MRENRKRCSGQHSGKQSRVSAGNHTQCTDVGTFVSDSVVQGLASHRQLLRLGPGYFNLWHCELPDDGLWGIRMFRGGGGPAIRFTWVSDFLSTFLTCRMPRSSGVVKSAQFMELPQRV